MCTGCLCLPRGPKPPHLSWSSTPTSPPPEAYLSSHPSPFVSFMHLILISKSSQEVKKDLYRVVPALRWLPGQWVEAHKDPLKRKVVWRKEAGDLGERAGEGLTWPGGQPRLLLGGLGAPMWDVYQEQTWIHFHFEAGLGWNGRPLNSRYYLREEIKKAWPQARSLVETLPYLETGLKPSLSHKRHNYIAVSERSLIILYSF